MLAEPIEIVVLSAATVAAILLTVGIYYVMLDLVDYVNEMVDDASESFLTLAPRIEAVASDLKTTFDDARTSIITNTEAFKADLLTDINNWKTSIESFAVNVRDTWDCAPRYFLEEVDTALDGIKTEIDAKSTIIVSQMDDPALYEGIVESIFDSISILLGCD